jgi:glycine/D-amino acid oxidase-like deaminating enzyme
MVRLMNRSIDILEQLAEESGNVFNMNRRGYLFATAREQKVSDFIRAGTEAQSLGAGPLRQHSGSADAPPYMPSPPDGYESELTGADLITNPDLIREHFPYLTPDTIAVLHARRCGWFSAQQLGRHLLNLAEANGARRIQGLVGDVHLQDGCVDSISVEDHTGIWRIRAPEFVIAAGPFAGEVANMIGVSLPIFNELHAKISFTDRLAAMPRHAPLVIWTDPQRLPWSAPEAQILAREDDTAWLLEEFPPQVHGRPEGPDDSPIVLLLWTYDEQPVEPKVPPEFDEMYYPEVVIRGMSTAMPTFKGYFQRLPKVYVDGGYYTKTRENRPLVCPLPVPGAYIVGALSGFGLMASAAAGELLAAHVAGTTLPDYAHWFHLDRYEDPEYRRLLERWDESGQI